jgi:crossover junction endonuclease MUS81
MDYIIKIDNREKELIKIMENKGFDMILENLDLGDIQILDLTTKEIIIIIERKTLSDLSASIKDGRYKEQKERLKHSLKKNVRKIILIEGDDMTKFTLSEKTFQSIIINTLIRDNMHIHITKNKEETFEFIENIIYNLSKYYTDLKNEIILGTEKEFNNEFLSKTCKKENLTEELCFRNMLTQIPGVSANIANIYMEKYKTMENFIDQIKKESNGEKDKMIKLIGNEKYGTTMRRVGDKVSEKIILYLLNKNEIK